MEEPHLACLVSRDNVVHYKLVNADFFTHGQQDIEELPVEDAQWNPAENYLITCYKDGTIKLFDGDKGTETLSFERQGAGKLFLAICRCQIFVLDAQYVRRFY